MVVARKTDAHFGVILFTLLLSFLVLGGAYLGGRLTDTARASTGDLGAWTATVSLPSPLWAFAAAVSPGYVYVSGGELTSGVNLTGTMRAAINADGSLGAWQDQTLLSAARIDHGMVYTETAAGNRCLYAVGGYTSQSETVTNSVEYASVGSDGAIGAWAQTSAMNTARAHFGLAAYNGRLYAVGGGTASVEFTSINSDCTLANPWLNTAVFTATHFANRAFAANGYLYNSGDISDTLASGVQYAPINNDGTLGAWVATSAMGQKRADHAVIVNTRAGYAYVLGGMATTPFTRTATVERASLNQDGTLGTWTPMASLPSPSEDMAFGQANGRIYMLGGSSGAITDAVIFSTIEGAGMPDLSTSVKRVSSASASPGQVLTYTVVLTNTGSGAANVLVTDTLPVSVTYVSGSATGGASYVTASRAITWTGAVAAGSAVTVTYSGVITSPLNNGTPITNTATVNDGVNVPFETAPVTTTISSAPDISTAAKAVDKTTATPGQTITYTVVLTNSGNMNASARVTDTLPVSVTYVSGSASAGVTYDTASRSIRWTGAVTVGTPVSITYRAVITSPLDNGLLVTNTATINDGNGSVFETAPVTTTISSAPDLSTSRKSVSRPISSPGGMVGYSIVVSNTGTMNTSARVTDTLPINLTYIANSLQSTMGTSLYDSSTGSILWAGPALVGVPVTVSYQARVPSSLTSGTLVANTATIHGVGGAARETSPVTVTVASNPSRIGWQNLGLFGVRAEDLEIDPAANVVYVASGGTTGIYRTLNGGETWLPSADFAGCLRLALDRSTGTVYANCRPGIDRGGLFKSTDNGVTWTPIINRSLYSAFGDSPSRDIGLAGSTLYVADGSGGVWVSTDAGAAWTRHPVGQSTRIEALAVDPTTPTTVYVATSNKAFKSVNSGQTWTEITPPFGGSDFRSIAVNPHNPSAVFIGTGADGGNHLYKSVDSGQTWTTISPGMSTWWIRFHPTDPNTMFTQGSRSIDNGATWQHLPLYGMGLAIDPTNPSIIYAGSSQGVHKSMDGGATWAEVNTGLEEVSVRGIAENPRDVNNFLIGTGQGYGLTLDNGTSWTWPLDLSALPQPDMAGQAVAIEPSTSYLSGGAPAILGRSIDSGATWSAGNLREVVSNDLGPSTGAGVLEFGIVPGETGHVFAALAESPEGRPVPKGGIYGSTDAGLTWTNTGFPAVPVNTIGFGITAGGTVIYAGVGDSWGRYAGAGGVYTSTVGNTSIWNQTSISTTPPVITKLRVDPANPLVVYAGGGFVDNGDPAGALRPAALYKTTDGGATWRDIMPAVGRAAGVRAIAIDPAFTSNVYFSYESKIYQTVDGGATWSLFSTANLGMEGVYALIVPLSAPSPVVNFTATISGSQAVLSWTNPSESDLAGVAIRYSTQGFPKLSTEGTAVATIAGAPGATGMYTQTGVLTGTTYLYSAFAHNQAGRYSSPLRAAANSSAAGLSTSASVLLQRSLSSLSLRPAAQASTRSLYAASGEGLFAKEIETAGAASKIYLPIIAKNFAAGW